MDRGIIWEEKSNRNAPLKSKIISTLIFPFLSNNDLWGWKCIKLQGKTPFWVAPEFEVERAEENFRSLDNIFQPITILNIFFTAMTS